MADNTNPTPQRQRNVDDVNQAWGHLQTFNTTTLPQGAGRVDDLAYVVSQKVGWF